MTTGTIQFRTATDPRALEQVFEQRYRVYTEEMGLYRDTADHANRQLRDDGDGMARHIAAFLGDRIVGSVRVELGSESDLIGRYDDVYDLSRLTGDVPVEAMAVAMRFTVDPEHRGGAVPLGLIAEAYRVMVDAGVEIGFLDCVPHLIRLYETLGFRRYGDNVRDEQVATSLEQSVLRRPVRSAPIR